MKAQIILGEVMPFRNMGIRIRTEVGGMEEAVFPGGGEDLDFPTPRGSTGTRSSCTLCLRPIPGLTANSPNPDLTICVPSRWNTRDCCLCIKANLTEHKMTMDRDPHPVSLVMRSKVCLNGCWSPKTHLSVRFVQLVQEAYRVYACVQHYDSPSQHNTKQ